MCFLCVIHITMRNKIMLQTTDEQFANIVNNSLTISEICSKLGLRIQGSNYKTIHKRIKNQNLSTNHFNPYKNRKTGKKPITDFLVENSNIGSNDLKKRLINCGILKNECSECCNQGLWNDKPLTLQLDHINGNHHDNRLDNLRILCPNCHTQTDTHSGKRLKKEKVIYLCPQCANVFSGKGKVCAKCHFKNMKKLKFPNKEELSLMVWNMNIKEISKKIKCSRTSVINYCESENIKLPPIGYWQRRKAGYSHEESLVSKAKIRQTKNLLSDETVKEIKLLFSQGLGCREIGRKLGLCHTKISGITRGKRYTHVI